jgi:membrane-associated protease RseP (regulator of RpoE activity)
MRDSQILTFNTSLAAVQYPKYDSQGNETNKIITRPFVGISPDFYWQTLSVTEVPKYMWDFTGSTIESLMSFPVRVYDLAYRMATGKERDPNGPISVVGVTRLSGEIAASDQSLRSKVQQIVGMAASLNLFLFLFNLLPLLPLDGGHVAGALFESIRRKIAKFRGKPDPGPVDIARMLPVTYLVSLLLLGAGLIVIVADTIAPISLNS